MSTTNISPEVHSKTAQSLCGSTLLPAIALGSFSALLLELSLTRLFSVVLFYHFAFLAISIALLGLGAGGVFAHLWKRRLGSWEVRQIASTCSAVSAIVIPVALGIVLHLPVSLELSGRNFLRLSVIYLCSAVPFFLTGLQFSVVFAREEMRIARLYGADLGGGALACLAVVPLLNWIGGPNAIVFAALSSAMAAIVWSNKMGARRVTLAVAGFLCILLGGNHSGKLFDIVWAKGEKREDGEFARWNAMLR